MPVPRTLPSTDDHDEVVADASADFPGCVAFRLPREDFDDYDGHIEFWDARTEVAWKVPVTTPVHEYPTHTLAALAERIAAMRGSPIICFGTMSLVMLDEHGERRFAMEADQSLYLHPQRVRLLGEKALVIGQHDHPDIILEVDHTTDARRRKLGLYQEWGFPELWVEVPDWGVSSRPRSRTPGLTIHLLDHGVYRVAQESRAFPGWRAAEIHAAMNETARSAETLAVLARVGSTLGAKEGTGPQDDPLLRSQRRWGFDRGRTQGRAEGRAQGMAEGRTQGRAEGMAKMARRILQSRGVATSADFDGDLSAFAAAKADAIAQAAFACTDEDDFHQRLRQSGD